jgi:predicted component of type VI protein secretion system
VEIRSVIRMAERCIAEIDRRVTEQVNAVLHHPRFQQLEASWRGLWFLAEQAHQTESPEQIKIRFLSVSRKELGRDLEKAVEFDQSQLFRRLYEDGFGIAGGEPYGVLIGDYYFGRHPDDVDLLARASGVAAAAFCPFIAAAAPDLLSLRDWDDVNRPRKWDSVFAQPEYEQWRSFRDSDDSRFVGLALPRVLMRLPYEDDGTRLDGFRFLEDVSRRDESRSSDKSRRAGSEQNPAASAESKTASNSSYLWGNAAYAFGAVLIRAFDRSRWFGDIHGVRRDVDGGGVVTDLPVHCFSTDRDGLVPKCSTDVIVTDQREPEFSDLGFLPLCHCKDTTLSAFYACQSVQKPRSYADPSATANARVSAMLHYTLCVSRFAHYLKVIIRDKIGSFVGPKDCEGYLHDWLQRYVTADPGASQETKAQYPLRQAEVEVWEPPGKPGCYRCIIRLWPHYELDGLSAALRLTTEVVTGSSR